MSSSRTSSMSSIKVSGSSKTKLSDFPAQWQTTLKDAWNKLKRQNRDAKEVNIKGREHPSSTVSDHQNVVSVQLLDENGNYLGSAHVDSNGNAFPNKKWGVNRSK